MSEWAFIAILFLFILSNLASFFLAAKIAKHEPLYSKEEPEIVLGEPHDYTGAMDGESEEG